MNDRILFRITLLLWVMILILSCVVMQQPANIGGKHRAEKSRLMTNCANPDGVKVIETGRVIEYGYSFLVYGDEIVTEDGTFWKVYDGTISADYICEAR